MRAKLSKKINKSNPDHTLFRKPAPGMWQV